MMQLLPHLWLFLVGSLIISSVQSEEINNDSFEAEPFLYGHDQNRNRHTTSSPKSFVCPSPSGRYPHESDCDRYYECRFGVPHVMKCDRNKLYDDKKEKCNDRHKVDCDRKDRERGTTTDFDEDDKELENDETFTCPYPWGTFPHPTLCYKYYVCRYNTPSLFQCQGSKLFDTRDRKCSDRRRVRCGDRFDRDDLKSSKRPSTKIFSTTPKPQKKTTLPKISTTTEKGHQFFCPFRNGRYPDPLDCAQFYECHSYYPTLYKCPRSTLYDERKEKCLKHTQVECGDRPEGNGKDLTTNQPKTTFSTTTAAKTTATATPTTTMASTTTKSPTTTAAPTTTEDPITAAPTTTEAPTTTSEPITKVTKPNTPPPTECEEDDLDCIIDETGDITGWFECPERYGHFAHGSSRQLFIHCDNYRPYVKKCADNTVFSPKNLVCMWIGNPGEIIE